MRWVLGLIAIVSIAQGATIIGPDSSAQVWLIIAMFATLFGCCWPWKERPADPHIPDNCMICGKDRCQDHDKSW